MNRGRFVRLDRREDRHRVFPKRGINRHDLRAGFLQLFPPMGETGEYRRFAVAQKIVRHAANAHLGVRRARHTQPEQRFGEQRRIAQIAKEPSEGVKAWRQMCAAAPESALMRQIDGCAIPGKSAERCGRANRASGVRAYRRNDRTFLYTRGGTAGRASGEAMCIVRLHAIPVVGILSCDAVGELM